MPRVRATAPTRGRRRRSLLAVLAAAWAATAAASAQEGGVASDPPDAARAQSLAAEVSADRDALEEIQRRSAAAEQELAEERARLDGWLAHYRPERAAALRREGAQVVAPVAPSEAEVARVLAELDASASLVGREALLEEIESLAAEAERDLDSARRREAARDEQERGALATLVWQREQRLAALSRWSDAVAELTRVRDETRTLLQAENLLLRAPSRIDRDSLARGIGDLAALPARLPEAAAAAARFAGDDRNRGPLWILLAVLAPFGLLLGCARAWLTRRAARHATLDLAGPPVRAALLLAHVGRAACVAAFFWLAPVLADWIVPGLPIEASHLLRGLGTLFALTWLGLRLNRELLRPEPPERALLRGDVAIARRLSRLIAFLLWFSFGAQAFRLALSRLSYGNAGAIEAIELLHRLVAGAVALVVLSHSSFLTGLVPPPERPLGRVLGGLVRLIQPVLVLLVPAVVALDVLGFHVLAAFVTRLAILALAVVPLGSLAYQGLAFFVDRWRDRELSKHEDDEAAAARIVALDDLARMVVRVSIVLLLGVFVIQVTGASFAGLRLFLETPLPLQRADDPAGAVTWWNLLAALLLAFVFLRLARHLKLALGSLVLPMTRLEPSIQYTVTTLVTHGVTALGLWLAVTQVVDVTSLGYLVAALSVGIGFGLQEIISNFVSGLILLIERPLKPGDLVEYGAGSVGVVRELGVRATTIRTPDNVHVLVPNRELITQRVVNYDSIDPRIRFTIRVGVAYGSDPKLVRQVLAETAARDGRILKKPAPEVFFLDFGESSLDFMIACWVADSRQHFLIASDLRFAIDAAFRRAGIAIPFPQRDVWLRSEQPLRVALEPARPGSEPKDRGEGGPR